MVKLDRYVGEPLFLLNTLRDNIGSDKDSVANIPLPHRSTGVEAMGAIADHISAVLYGANFLCQWSADRIWLLRTAATTEWTDHWPVQQYNLEKVVLQAVCKVFGHPIRPVSVRLNRIIDQRLLPDEMQGIPIELSNATMGLAFDLSDLLSRSGGMFLQPREYHLSGLEQPDDTSIWSIGACIAAFLGSTDNGRLSEKASRAFGMSERSYRRRLREMGVSHNQLVADARLSIADSMLRDPSYSITDIALELGYAHPPAFTRFFSDRVGMTPLEYRRRKLN